MEYRNGTPSFSMSSVLSEGGDGKPHTPLMDERTVTHSDSVPVSCPCRALYGPVRGFRFSHVITAPTRGMFGNLYCCARFGRQNAFYGFSGIVLPQTSKRIYGFQKPSRSDYPYRGVGARLPPPCLTAFNIKETIKVR